MKTRLMFVEDSEPVTGTRVRFPDLEGANEFEVDSEGFVEAELPSGRLRAEVEKRGTWIEQTIEIRDGRSMLVVNLDAPSTDENLSSDPTHAGTPPTAPGEPASGLDSSLLGDMTRRLGTRYSFDEVLGRGGMGVVLRARDTLLERTVAIKMLNEEFRDNEEAQQLFLAEARNVSALSHSGMASVHDITTIDGRALIVLEYVDGEDVDDLVTRHGALSPIAALRVAIQLARTLSYLHGEGLVHRDIKPANLLLQDDGSIKLVDFGLARSLEDLYVKGTRIRGTPAYMAPEQVLGDTLTAATDMYQFGVTLFELLTGELPFDSGDIAYAHVHVEPPSLAESAPECPQSLVELVGACLSKEPDVRPSSAQCIEILRDIYVELAERHGGLGDDLDISDSLLFSTGNFPGGPAADRVRLVTTADSGEGLPDVSSGSQGAPEAASMISEISEVEFETRADREDAPRARRLIVAAVAASLLAAAAVFFYFLDPLDLRGDDADADRVAAASARSPAVERMPDGRADTQPAEDAPGNESSADVTELVRDGARLSAAVAVSARHTARAVRGTSEPSETDSRDSDAVSAPEHRDHSLAHRRAASVGRPPRDEAETGDDEAASAASAPREDDAQSDPSDRASEADEARAEASEAPASESASSGGERGATSATASASDDDTKSTSSEASEKTVEKKTRRRVVRKIIRRRKKSSGKEEKKAAEEGPAATEDDSSRDDSGSSVPRSF